MKNLILILLMVFSFKSFASKKFVTDASMGADVTSAPIVVSAKSGYAVQAVYTGSPVGTLTLEGSVDGSNWQTIDGSSTAISSASNTLYNVSYSQYSYFRLFFDYTSGSGVLNAFHNLKD